MHTRRCARSGLGAGLIGLVVLGAALASAALASPHPRLLITPEDIPRLRHACGIGAAPGPVEGLGRAGARAAEFQALRTYFAEREGDELLPGELAAAAFLHLVDPDDPLDPQRIGVINRALRQPLWIVTDTFETLLALDWCWDALDAEARRSFLYALRKRATPLTPADSPLDQRAFAEKLVVLAATVAVDEQDDPSPTWAKLRQRIRSAAREYFASTFPAFVSWRGLAPTSPAAGPQEERDTALAVELAGYVLKREQWPVYRESVGRWLEHYVFASFSHAALQHHFIRDDGNRAPLSPAPRWHEMLPLTAHLIAARTQDPAAAFVARRVEQRLRGPAAEPRAAPWRWVPIVLETSHIPRCDFARLPAARNFGGAVVFRGRRGPQETGIWIEAGQPFLRPRQHFDAGHFLIYSDGQLAVAGGDDILFEATPAKRGLQRLGRKDGAFDFEQYFTSTIAHNCLIQWDPVRAARWYGARYEPAGGQRPIQDICTDFTAPLEGHVRQTARQLAYGQHGSAAYLALDLAPACQPRTVTGYTREFVFLLGRALVVVDRVNIARRRAEPVWVVNLPARPSVDGQSLSDQARLEGSENDAGIWRYDAARRLRWCDGDGCLWMYPLLPDSRRLYVAGGPARKLVVPHGPHTARTYLGGEADGFERLIRPAGHGRPQNAWYRLGQPTLLGPAFGISPHWGRIEVEPAEKSDRHVFVNVFVVEADDARRKPSATVQRSDQAIAITLDTGTDRAILQLRPDHAPGGMVEYPNGRGGAWEFPTHVDPDTALPTD